MRGLARIVLAVLVATCGVAVAAAQGYPNRAIRLIVAFPPGGATDIIARAIGAPLGERLGQTVVIDNRPGSNGNIAADLAANAPPNGYTLFHGFDSLFSINPHLYSRMTVDPHKAFVPVGTMISNQLVLAVNPKVVPVKDFREFIEFARRANPPLFYASIGNGSQHHLAMEMLKRQAGIEMTHVPFKGGGPAGISVMAGESALMFGGGSVVPHIKSGKLKGLAVSGAKRSPALPELPTIGEFYPGYEVPIWHALFAPVGTPPEIVGKLRTELNAVLAIPEVGQRMINTGSGEPYVTTPEEFAAVMRRDYERYGKVIKEIGLKVD
jgi:tripartite-type tricarboxylate transporter receptor subunit TctC